MPRNRRRRDAVAAIASAVIHLGLLVVVARQAPMLRIPEEHDEPAEDAIRVTLLPRLPSETAAQRPEPLKLHRPALPAPPSVAPAPAPPGQAAQAAPPGPVAIHPGPLPEGPKGELRAALRGGTPGCGNIKAVGLSRAERDACDERFGKGSKAAKFIPAPLDPGIRAYYDAVTKAKAPDGPLTPQTARGRAGLFDDVAVGAKGHGPGFGCHIGFGGGKVVVGRPAHGLKVGPLPCFIVPPVGSLDPDGDVKNPDQLLRNGEKP